MLFSSSFLTGRSLDISAHAFSARHEEEASAVSVALRRAFAVCRASVFRRLEALACSASPLAISSSRFIFFI